MARHKTQVACASLRQLNGLYVIYNDAEQIVGEVKRYAGETLWRAQAYGQDYRDGLQSLHGSADEAQAEVLTRARLTATADQAPARMPAPDLFALFYDVA